MADISLPHCLRTGVPNLAHQSDFRIRAEISGNLLRIRSGAISRGSALLVISLYMRGFATTKFLTICIAKKSPSRVN